jgi:APA family basic amino acid/polyamine antiporter
MTQTLLTKLLRTKPVDRSVEDGHGEGGLARPLGLFSVTMIGVGATIGTGIFFTMVEAVPKAGPSVILSFLIAAVTAGLTALCYAELAARIPASGSSYSFAYATVGEFAAFMMAACLLLEYGLAASATAIGWSDYLNNFLANALHWEIPRFLRSPMIVSGDHRVEIHAGQFNLPPVLLVVLCGIMLIRGTKESATTNAIMVLIKLTILVFFVVVAFSGFDARNLHPFFNPDDSKGLGGMVGVTAAAGTVFFSFIGLDTVACAGGEVRNPRRNVPLGIMAALIIVTVFYVFVATAALGAQPASKFAGQEAGLAVILETVTGRAWPAIVLSAGAVISVFSVTLVSIYGQTRILYSISRDGLVPTIFQRINARTRTPIGNTVIVCTMAGGVSGLVDANFLWDMVSMGTLTAFCVVSVAVPVLRHRQRSDPSAGFRVPFGPYLVPGLSVAACLFIMKDLSANTLRVFAYWMGFAVMTYFLYGLRRSKLNG